MTPGDLYACQVEWSRCDSPAQAADVLARAFKLPVEIEREIAFILGGGDLRTYQTGYDDGQRDGWDEGRSDLRSEIDMNQMREKIDAAKRALEGIQAKVDETVSEAVRALDDARHNVKEG